MEKSSRGEIFYELNQKNVENINRSTRSIEVEAVIKNVPTNESPGPSVFTGEFYQPFRKYLTRILPKLFQKMAEGKTLSR